jgi:MAX-like protein X
MVSEFEAEAQDDEENVAIPVPDESEVKLAVKPPPPREPRPTAPATNMDVCGAPSTAVVERRNSQTVAIDSSLTKLFQCMSLAYR